MSKYLSNNYSGSILERASYKKDKDRPYKLYGSIIERKIKSEDENGLWRKLKKIMCK